MKKLKYLSLSLCLLAGLTACTAQQGFRRADRRTGNRMALGQRDNCSRNSRTPCRTKSVIGLTVPKMEVVRVGFCRTGHARSGSGGTLYPHPRHTDHGSVRL